MASPHSPARGAARTRSVHARQLLRVGGVTYTIDELALAAGRTPDEIRKRTAKLMHWRSPFTLEDFRNG